ncbi:MAG TPA: efflux RND transporter permease subunit [candidate division Zixibacteria bacterium]|nr:efflux RND transporter permease subunit [candidate division Zixibacteria bacterium]HEQ98097.1 efflux RND transporter permease subunit [candidate division Zixibacteria bacterium]
MSLIKSSIKYPVTVVVAVLIITISGFLALKQVPIQLTPEVQQPIITVSTTWVGASPEEIEREIIEEQEEYLKSVEGVEEMRSESQDGRGTITLEFPVGTDLTGAVVRVTNKLNEVPSYPQNAERPVVRSSGETEGAIAWFIVRALDSNLYIPHQERLIEDIVKPRLERVEGVASINIYGGLEQELHVVFDPDLLASSGITVDMLANALRAENRDISAGDFGEGKRKYVVRTTSRFESIEDVEETVVAVQNGVPIRVRDVAEVSLDFEKPIAMVRNLGSPAIAFNAQRQVGANVLEVLDDLLKQVDILNREVMNPRGMNIVNAYNETTYINSAIDLVFSNIYLGGFLAILVLFIFLRSASAIAVIALSIPISIISTFLAMSLFGRTINVISLAGMAFAVGMVVDSSIVVLENIYRHMQMGKSKWQAAADGAREVWGALLASTVTTIAVFLPIMFVEEQAGQLFQDIAIAISSAIVISLLVSITVIPTLSSRALKVSSKLQGSDQHKSLLGRFAARVAAFVDFINARGARRLGTIIGIVVFAMFFTWLLLPDAEYLPNGNRNLVFAFMLPPPGYNIDEMVRAGQTIESQIKPLWEAEGEEAEEMPGGGIENFFFVAFSGQAFFGMASRDHERASELVQVANKAIFSIPGSIGFASQTSLFGRGFAGTRSVRIDVTGPELGKVLQIAGQVFGQVGQILPGSNSRPIPGLDLGNPEVRVIPDRVRAADVNLTASQIGLAVNALVDGAIVSDYYHNGKELDLIIKGRENWTRHTQDISQLPLATNSGKLVTVGDVADVVMRQGPVQINHVERQRTVSIETVLPDEIPLEKAMVMLENDIISHLRSQGQVGGLYDINLSGTADDLSKLRAELTTDFHLAIILTYLLLSALFQSFTYPLVILLTVPLATFGGVLGLNVVQLFDSSQQFDILTMLGFVILVGTVINNSILIVYYALQLMREGWDARSAVKESVRVRVRPIFMSTGTSTLAMLPLIIMPGAGSELYRGLGSVVVGGLAVSTVTTLILTPLVFSYAIELTVRIKGFLGMKRKAVSTAPAVDSPGSTTAAVERDS